MENIDEINNIKQTINKTIKTLIDKKFKFLTPQDFLLFVDTREYNSKGLIFRETLVITKVEDFPRDKRTELRKLRFLKKENYFFGDFLYLSKSTKQTRKLNKDGRKTLFLSLDYQQEKITNVYKEIISNLPLFDIIVLDLSPEENEFALPNFYEDNEYAYFNDFVWSYDCLGRYDRRFSAFILDENKNLIYNRELFFESEEDFELRDFIESGFHVKPQEIDISKRIETCRLWRNDPEDEGKEIKGALYQINKDYSWSLLKTFTEKKSDKK